jgi:hypothetical protein
MNQKKKKKALEKTTKTQPITWQKSTSEENLDGPGMSGKKPFGTGSNVTTRGPATSEDEENRSRTPKTDLKVLTTTTNQHCTPVRRTSKLCY